MLTIRIRWSDLGQMVSGQEHQWALCVALPDGQSGPGRPPNMHILKQAHFELHVVDDGRG